jgi:glycosyltransferase involved in cell wall biosynthesis
MDTDDFGFFKKIFTMPNIIIKKKLFNLADLVICASLDYLGSSQLNNIYKKNSEKFIEIPFSVDTNKFKPVKKEKKENIKITFVGGMDKAHNFKGVDVLIKAFARIKNTNIKLNLIGNGDLIDTYKKLALSLNLDDRIEFLSGISDSDKIVEYQNSDIFVLPSINSHEAFGIVLLEAMSCGVPVIASSLPGVRKVFHDNEQGLLVKPGDVNDLKKKLERLIMSQDLRARMGLNARKLAENNYSKKRLNKKTEKVLLELLKK